MIIFNTDGLTASFLSLLIIVAVAGGGVAYFFEWLRDYINKKKK